MTFLSSMLGITACPTLHITPFRRSTILFHCLCMWPIFTPIASVPSGPTIFLHIIILGKVGFLLIVMDLRERSIPNMTLVMTLNSKLIMLLTLEYIMNEVNIVLGPILVLEDLIRVKYSLKSLFNLVPF
jgi:hypothetical protein